MVVDVAAGSGSGVESPALHDALLEPVIEAIRHEARETDRVARVGATRFCLLLPETLEGDADRFVERLASACHDRLNGHGTAVRLRIESVTPGHGRSLRDALDEVERRLTA
jgi:GGDEF domain-containing protein